MSETETWEAKNSSAHWPDTWGPADPADYHGQPFWRGLATTDRHYVHWKHENRSTEKRATKSIPLGDDLVRQLRKGIVNPSAITTLDLSHCSLREVPSSIKSLNLKKLNLAHNLLTAVPVCLYTSQEYLECLDLSHNLLSSFEVEPACCRTIKRLVLNHNKINNFPQWIVMGQAPNLTEVVYTNNSITHFQRPLRKLNIKTLELASCLLRDEDFRFLTELTELRTLKIGNLVGYTEDKRANRFEHLDEFFSKFYGEYLQYLNMSNISIGKIPKDLFWNDRLVELHLSNCEIFVISHEIKFLIKLEILDVSYNSLSGFPAEIGELKELRILKAPGNILDHAPRFKSKLEILDLYDNRLIVFPEFDAGLPSFIDLELNFMCLSSSTSYCENKKQFRSFFSLRERSDGSRQPENCWRSNSSSTLSSLGGKDDVPSSKQEPGRAQRFNNEENWDEEVKKTDTKKVESHPDVTQSDDEWDAKTPLPKYQPLKYIRHSFPPDPDEDWIFCDVNYS